MSLGVRVGVEVVDEEDKDTLDHEEGDNDACCEGDAVLVVVLIVDGCDWDGSGSAAVMEDGTDDGNARDGDDDRDGRVALLFLPYIICLRIMAGEMPAAPAAPAGGGDAAAAAAAGAAGDWTGLAAGGGDGVATPAAVAAVGTDAVVVVAVAAGADAAGADGITPIAKTDVVVCTAIPGTDTDTTAGAGTDEAAAGPAMIAPPTAVAGEEVGMAAAGTDADDTAAAITEAGGGVETDSAEEKNEMEVYGKTEEADVTTVSGPKTLLDEVVERGIVTDEEGMMNGAGAAAGNDEAEGETAIRIDDDEREGECVVEVVDVVTEKTGAGAAGGTDTDTAGVDTGTDDDGGGQNVSVTVTVRVARQTREDEKEEDGEDGNTRGEDMLTLGVGGVGVILGIDDDTDIDTDDMGLGELVNTLLGDVGGRGFPIWGMAMTTDAMSVSRRVRTLILILFLFFLSVKTRGNSRGYE
ncbi:hypothetical protein UA08_00068 [Talaromyces atroroseus]|uniref:Uncharacterized protein n=1 Tax=Talaromyces atroroseus TaxID=1441469 RepID=A0A225B0K6_TALAT|nr:hypothetical protein UA08_00068 [Talaromyces atroroseus]OKL64244.1 hypothetical protein UA08_00068 [Talaromyces atroroseus]